MVYVDRITRAIRQATGLGVLRAQDEGDEPVAVDPVGAADHRQAAQHPPAVAHVLLLLGAAVQAAAGDLALAEPRGQLLDVDEVDAAGDGQRRDAREDLARVGLGAGADPVPAVEVGAGRDVADRLVDVDQVQRAQEGERVQGAVEEPRVFFAPLVAGERAGLSILQICNDWSGERAVVSRQQL